jgi:hypothetical protein
LPVPKTSNKKALEQRSSKIPSGAALPEAVGTNKNPLKNFSVFKGTSLPASLRRFKYTIKESLCQYDFFRSVGFKHSDSKKLRFRTETAVSGTTGFR